MVKLLQLDVSLFHHSMKIDQSTNFEGVHTQMILDSGIYWLVELEGDVCGGAEPNHGTFSMRSR